MSKRALVLEAHHTTHIEGTRLSLDEASRLLAGERVPEARPDDTRELLNYRTAFEFVSKYLESGDPVTEGLIREIHHRLVAGVRGGEGGPGVYRTVQTVVANSTTGEVVYTPPPPLDVPPLMRELVEWLGAEPKDHTVLVAGIAQFQLVHIHPFLDGNGRTSRLLSTLLLYRAGYDFKRLFTISEYYDRDRAAFYGALRSVREKGMDLTGWLEFFVEGLSTQLAEVRALGAIAIRSDLVGREHGLNTRQVLAVGQLLQARELKTEDLEALCPGVHRRTLQRDLRQLVEKRVLKSSGAGRAVRYRLALKGL
ncbi:MAG: Fic family protein [Thermoanaerobaculia bacterium]